MSVVVRESPKKSPPPRYVHHHRSISRSNIMGTEASSKNRSVIQGAPKDNQVVVSQSPESSRTYAERSTASLSLKEETYFLLRRPWLVLSVVLMILTTGLDLNEKETVLEEPDGEKTLYKRTSDTNHTRSRPREEPWQRRHPRPIRAWPPPPPSPPMPPPPPPPPTYPSVSLVDSVTWGNSTLSD